MSPEYHNKTDEVPVGEKYESVTVEEGTINIGDLVVWNDPDCGYDDESVTESLWIGRVTDIYKRADGPEFGLSCPLGRVAFDQHMTAVSGPDIVFCRNGGDMAFIDNFLNSEYEEYMNVEWTRNGDTRVSGE